MAFLHRLNPAGQTPQGATGDIERHRRLGRAMRSAASSLPFGWYNGAISDFAWFRRDMPWLGPGFIYCIHDEAEQVLRQELARLDFSVFTLAGRELRDADSLHSELARTFVFPDYYGGNWDAFHDCFDDPALPGRSALLWTHAERLAQADLKAFAEAVAVFRETADALSRNGRQFALMLLGTGPGFRRPSDPVDPAWQRLPL